MKKNLKNKKSLNIAMLGHKRIPSREGGIEIVVEELATRMVTLGHKVTCYNRSGHHVSGKDFDGGKRKAYKGVRLKSVLTLDKKGLAAMTASVSGAICAAFGKYDVVHFHTKGKFLIVMKDGPYNGINGTYDGRHGAYTATEFREYVDYLEKLYSNLYCWAKDDDKWKELPDDMLEERILNLKEFNRNPVNHENQEWANKNNSKNHEKYREQQKSRSYIRQEYSPSVLQTLSPEEIIPLGIDEEGNVFRKDLSLGKYGLQGWTIEEILHDIMDMPETTSKIFEKVKSDFDVAMDVKGYQYPQQLVWFASKQANAHDFFS